MPELPEVETVRRGVEPHLHGARLHAFEFARRDLRWPMPIAALLDLVGRRCTGTARRSKYLLLHFDGRGRPVALVHLGMSGRLFLDVLGPRGTAAPWRPHEHWRMRFGRRLLRYVDARRFGALDVVPAAELASHPRLEHLGPEPLDADFEPEYLFRATRRRTVAIKTFLMDARHVVGVGNIYASEACFRAAVRPSRRAGTLTRAECARLVAGVRAVLEAAITAGGTTLRDYVGVDEHAGAFQLELSVYGRDGQPCRSCGAVIRRIRGGRSTFYCPSCQR